MRMNNNTRRLIEALYTENSDLIKYLSEQGEVSFVASVDKTFNKVLLLAIASYFEKHITDILKQFFTVQSGNNPLLLDYITRTTLDRKYHTLFTWDTGKKSGINPFLKIFGESFRKEFDELTQKDKKLESGILEFLELGNKRNELVHENFIGYLLQYSPQEIYDKFEKAVYFVDRLQIHLSEHFNYTDKLPP